MIGDLPADNRPEPINNGRDPGSRAGGYLHQDDDHEANAADKDRNPDSGGNANSYSTQTAPWSRSQPQVGAVGQQALKDSARRLQQILRDKSPRKAAHTAPVRSSSAQRPLNFANTPSGGITKTSLHKQLNRKRISPLLSSQPATVAFDSAHPEPTQHSRSYPQTPTENTGLRRKWEDRRRHLESSVIPSSIPPPAPNVAATTPPKSYSSSPPSSHASVSQVNDEPDDSQGLPSKQDLINRMIAYSRARQATSGSASSRSTQASSGLTMNFQYPQRDQADRDTLAPSPVLNDAPSSAFLRRRSNNFAKPNLIYKKEPRQVRSTVIPISSGAPGNHRERDGGSRPATASKEHPESDARASGSTHEDFSGSARSLHGGDVFATKDRSNTAPLPRSAMFTRTSDDVNARTSGKPPSHATETIKQNSGEAPPPVPRPASSPPKSDDRSRSNVHSDRSRAQWKEYQWRQFSRAMRDSLSLHSLSFDSAITLLSDIKSRLPAEMQGIPLDELLRRLVVWVNRTENMQRRDSTTQNS